jgi:hypothetical protein
MSKRFILCLVLSFFPATLPAQKNVGSASRSQDHSVHRGIIRHGEHLVDLVLAQAGTTNTRHLDAFETIVRSLIEQAANQSAPLVNEKIDGSPSIVLGFTPEGKPFVAYKGQVLRTVREQQLVTTPSEAKRFFSAKPVLAAKYASLINRLAPRLRAIDSKFHELIFQGDLLFAEEDDGKQINDGSIVLQPNTIPYTIPPDSLHYSAIARAKVGLVIHTVGKRKVDAETGRLLVEPIANRKPLVDAFVAGLRSPNVFAITPLRRNVPIALETPLSSSTVQSIDTLLDSIRADLSELPETFTSVWRSQLEPSWRPFFNSGVRPPANGGIYLKASKQEPFAFEELVEQYRQWATQRAKATLELSQLEAVLQTDSEALERVLRAYYHAIEIQYLLQPSLSEMFQSVLGGAPVEGVMLEHDSTIVKLVDRLQFTLRNNAYRERASSLAQFDLYPEPFDQWRPGAIFLVGKFQPVHIGHIEMIRQIRKQYPDKELYIIASAKAPNLAATHWKDLGAAPRKGDLSKGEYTHVFDQKLRRLMFQHSLGDLAPVYFLDAALFSSYVRLAHAQGLEGNVYRAVGEKEMEAGRFNDEFEKWGSHVKPLAIDMQEGGISATQLRAAIAELSSLKKGEIQETAEETLQKGLSMITDDQARKRVCAQLIRQWKKVDRRARELIKK